MLFCWSTIKKIEMVFGVCLSEVLLLVMGGVFVGDEEQKWVRFGWFSRGLEEAV